MFINSESINGGGHKMASGAILNSWDELDKMINLKLICWLFLCLQI